MIRMCLLGIADQAARARFAAEPRYSRGQRPWSRLLRRDSLGEVLRTDAGSRDVTSEPLGAPAQPVEHRPERSVEEELDALRTGLEGVRAPAQAEDAVPHRPQRC
jgi:hypothetical protein